MMHKMLEGLEKGAKRIEQLIRGLKEYSHLENTQSGQGLDVRTVVETAVTITGSLIRNSTHRFPVQLPDTLPRVRGNNSQIEQMIVNLIANACQALSNPDQAITITARHDQGSDTVAIRIRNEGVGIAADHLHRITDPFYTTRRDSGGTGLGLSLCHRIAETNGGQLSFVSRVGTGTTVTGTLPLHKPDRPHNQLQQESQSRTD